MKKSLVLIFVIFCIAISACARETPKADQGNDIADSEDYIDNAPSGAGSTYLIDFLKKNGKYKCTLENQPTTSIYIQDGEYVTESLAGDIKINTVLRKEADKYCIYNWFGGETTGVKKCVTPAEFETPGSEDDFGAYYSVNCNPYSGTVNLDLPEGIAFPE